MCTTVRLSPMIRIIMLEIHRTLVSHSPLLLSILFRLDIMDNAVAAMHMSYRNPWNNTSKSQYPNWLIQTSAFNSIAHPHLWVHGSNRTMPFKSKHKVHESSRTLNFRSCSKNKWRGKTILSWSFRYACELKLSNDRVFGGNLNGSEPKLKRHCWNDMHDAAAKNPSLQKHSTILDILWNIFGEKRYGIARVHLLCTAEDLFENATLNTVQTENHFVSIQIQEAPKDRSTLPRWQIVRQRFCIMPNESTATIESNRIRIVTNAISLLQYNKNFNNYYFNQLMFAILIPWLTWLKKFESFVAHPICITPGVMMVTS